MICWSWLTPATTCAFVITWSGAKTNPEPSIRREQDVATPITFTTLSRARTRPAERTTRGSGGATADADSAPSEPKTDVYGPLASRPRKSENIVLAAGGMTLSTPWSTADRFTWLEIAAKGAFTTAEPISQAMSRTDSTLMAAPAAESAKVAGRQLTRERIIAPTAEASSWPIIAARKTTTMATRACLDC